VEFMLHVGDSIAEDVAGAEASGAQAMLLDRRGARAGRSAIRSLAQLAAVLAQASTKTPTD
jgi:FMN phosphatase YigB (HAD superfamily)